MKSRVIFGEWKPDQPEHLNDGMVTVDGVFPIANGYAPMKQYAALTPALASGFLGGTAFVASDKTASLLAGTATNLYRYSGSSWASVLGSLTAGRYSFTQFGDLAIGTHGGAPIKYNLLTGAAAALGGSPPLSKYCATVRDFVFVAGVPTDISRVSWCSSGNAESWTSGVNQAGSTPLYDGGEITGITGGEYALVFQRGAINRFSFTGPPATWQRDVISTNIGCIAPGSLAQAGRRVFFLSERGFMVTDGASEPVAIGSERVDRTFFSQYPRSSLTAMYAAVDPRRHLVIWSMPGAPGRLWIHNWEINRWATATLNLVGVFSGFTANVGLDAVGGAVDSNPYTVDDPRYQGGEPQFLVASSDGTIGTLTGANMAAVFSAPLQEFSQGQDARVFRTRPIIDATSGLTMALDIRRRLGDVPKVRTATDLRASGHVPMRATGRYVGGDLSVAAGTTWTYAQGFELEHGAGGQW
jgi:hypothetical protein